MRLTLLPLALGASAYVLTDHIKQSAQSLRKSAGDLLQHPQSAAESAVSSFYHRALATTDDFKEYLDIQGGQHAFELFDHPHHDPHSPHPHPPGKDKPSRPPKHGKNPHDQKDKSIYEFIAESEYFTILHDIIKGDKHAVAELNKTSANLTFFAPTNRALEKYKEHTPPVEYLRKILLYHLLPEVYPAGRVLRSKTLETLYVEDDIGQAQRLAVDINLKGLTLNYYARVIYIDIFTNNGVVHALDNLLFPPPKIYDIAEVLPSSFSTFINAAWKTGLVETLNETEKSTIFAPSNSAFASLGARINAYLFSTRGQPVLTKLLKYHIVPDVLFYSDAFYGPESSTRGLVQHHELTTLLGSQINVDVSEWGRFKTIVFNGRAIRLSDIPAKNGVLSELRNGIILPYKNSLSTTRVEDMTIEQFESLFEGPEETVPALFRAVHDSQKSKTCTFRKSASSAASIDGSKVVVSKFASGKVWPNTNLPKDVPENVITNVKAEVTKLQESVEERRKDDELLALLQTEDTSSIEEEMYSLF
ncbi:Fasciclin domain family [Taphrina deformans PYCC 5710]|uniref:Fasciclin domain family n=1 Tax=Taphrina deformans (strain PYCC 5710 / ATCC 11124 / CBS 356.35 / IMI 108563 / JCM 9778 / NBRC 8474) TaxID=1097556 RepID=R4X6H5_TAPDE|nr:Fasciclin domain family [Taphrina deformans PYCC 5710]|eukprot:CCG80700.1 Fasciclin domain family [Taphrina deformans PYCC 5710]